jgi:outer membrane protein assembly factor BamB
VNPLSLGRWFPAGRRAKAASALCILLQLGLGSIPLTQTAGAFTPGGKAKGNWPGFRGPGGNGHAVNANPPLTWDIGEGRNLLWKTAVPLPGMSSPVVWDDRLFLTGADDLSRQILCFASDTGKLLWRHEASGIPGSPPPEKLPKVMAEPGLAAPTATTDGRFVAAIFATGDLVCLTMEGKRAWAKNLGVPNNHYGHASSLICHEGLLFVQYDQKQNSKLLAFDLATGNLAWQVDRGVISWSSPLIVENKGRRELILTNSKAVDGYDPKTGKLLWHVECLAGEVAPSATYTDGVVYAANEYATALALDIGNHDSGPKLLWQWDAVLPDASSPLAAKGLLIVPSGFGAVNCLDGKTGKVLWEHEFDVGFFSSPILVKDRVYLIDASGTAQVFKLAEKFELLGTSKTGENVHATPAFVGGRIYVRGVAHLFCVAEQNR